MTEYIRTKVESVKHATRVAAISAMLLVAVLEGATIACASALKHHSTITINRGGAVEVCRAIAQLFDVPQNQDYLWTSTEVKAKGIKAATKEGYNNRQLYIPRDRQFKDFSQPQWVDVDDIVARGILPTLIDHQFRRQNHLVLGKDYKIQKTEFDLDGDGKKNTIYRSVGKGYMRLLMDEASADPFAKAFKELQSREGSAHDQLFYYKGWPYAFARYGVFDVSAHSLSFGELAHRLARIDLGHRCQFSAAFKGRLD